MNIDERIKMYSKEYHFELEQKEKIFGRLTIIFVILTACLGGLSTTLPKFPTLLNTTVIGTLTVLLSIAILVSLTLIIFHIVRFVSAKNDELIPSANEMENYHSQLKTYYSQNSSSLSNCYVDDKFSQFLLNAYIQASTTTYDNNCFKLKCLNRCYEQLTIFILSTLILCSFPIYLDQPKGNDIMTQNTVTIPEPIPPSNRVIRSDESFIPQKPPITINVNVQKDEN